MNVYEKAIQVLQEKGHCKGAPRNRETGEVCAVTALHEAQKAGQQERYSIVAGSAVGNANRYLLQHDMVDWTIEPHSGLVPLAHWNDHQASTEDLILLFKTLGAEQND